MGLHVDFCLMLVILMPTFAGSVDFTSYVPRITQMFLVHVTNTTFFLDQPSCLLNKSEDDIWLVVASGPNMPDLTNEELEDPIEYSANKSYYHTLRVKGSDYPCKSENTTVASLEVGSQKNCSGISYCNAPLKSNQSYWVKFVALNGVYNTDNFPRTKWSNEIKTKDGSVLQHKYISTHHQNSGGMITLTVIIVVLLAILLTCLIFALFIGSKNICWRRSLYHKNLLPFDLGKGGSYKLYDPNGSIYI